MKRSCRHVAELLQRRASGLSKVEGLELEEHLHACAECREAANLLSGLRALYVAHVPRLGAVQREGAIARAIAATPTFDPLGAITRAERRAAPANETALGGEDEVSTKIFGRGEATPLGRSRRVPRLVRRMAPAIWLIPPALAAAAVLAIVRGPTESGTTGEPVASGNTAADRTGTSPLSGRDADAARGDDRAPREVAAAATPASGTDRVVTGRIEVDGVEVGPALTLKASQQLSSAKGATLALGHATAQLRAASRVRWDAEQERLELMAGSVEVSVDPAPKRRFSVSTARFTALVLGTVFEVSHDRVRVREGRVRVIDRSGAELAVLDAKKRSVFELRADSGVGTSAPDPADVLERAREQISQRQLAEARRSLARVLTLAITREQRAEAYTLEADCALVAGDYTAARDKYLDVARDFPNLPAGQTALFAGARLEAEHGEPARADDLFRRYLEHYPSGRFAREAAARLRDEKKVVPPRKNPAE